METASSRPGTTAADVQTLRELDYQLRSKILDLAATSAEFRQKFVDSPRQALEEFGLADEADKAIAAGSTGTIGRGRSFCDLRRYEV